MRSHLAMAVVVALGSAACTQTLHQPTGTHACRHAHAGGTAANGMGIIGMSLDERAREVGHRELVVDRVVPDGPAAAAGIRAGDRILEIEGAKTDGMSIADAARRLRGPIDASVTLVIATGNRPRDVTITRVAPSDLWSKHERPPAGDKRSDPVHATDVAPAAPGAAPPCRR